MLGSLGNLGRAVSVARNAYDGVEVLDGKIYFVGGEAANSSEYNILEKYDPVTNTWETLASMNVARKGVASLVLNGKTLCNWWSVYLSSLDQHGQCLTPINR